MYFITVVIIASSAASSFALPNKQKAPPAVPSFGDAYHATGTIHIPYAELHQPFEIYYNGTFKASVTNVYNGVDVVYNRGDVKDGGIIYKLSPAVIKTKIVPQACFHISGTKESPVMPVSMLPDITGFTYQGLTFEGGQRVNMWLNTTTVNNRTSKYTFYTTLTKPTKPVRYEMMGYDSLLGSHYDKYVVDYITYEEPKDIPRSTFDYPAGLKCTDFPGPGIEGRIIANPFQEMAHPERGDRYEQLFTEYMKKHNRQYASVEEQSQRQAIFSNNVRYIHGHNRKPLTYKLAINHLADKHTNEIRRSRGRLVSKGYNGGQPFDTSDIDLSAIPENIDWRLKGAVSQVKDQAICGSCWSFGAVGAIEGAYFVKNQKMVRFSQQNLMDCSWDYGNNGCDGGEEWRSYQYVMENGGLMTEEDYGAYLGQNGFCHFNKSIAQVKIKSYKNVTSGDQNSLKQAIAVHGPVAVGIDASHPSLSFYSHGIYYEPKCGNTPDDLDHAVLAVGYGKVGNSSYWLIKNSWSTYWGNNGYVLMDWKENNCGVATDATFVTLA